MIPDGRKNNGVLRIVVLVVCIHNGISDSTQASVSPSTVTTVRAGTAAAFITEWRWIAEDGSSARESRGPGPRMDQTVFSRNGEQWFYGGHTSSKNFSDLWSFGTASLDAWTRVTLPAGLIMSGPPKRVALCSAKGVLALYPLEGDTVWLLEIDDNVWTAFLCFGSSLNGNESTATKTYCPGSLEDGALYWCDVDAGHLYVLSSNVTWSFSLSSPHWRRHDVPSDDVEKLSRCKSIIHASLAEGENSGLYLLCGNGERGARNIYRLKIFGGGPKLQEIGSLSLISSDGTSLAMAVAYCDDNVALIIAQEDNLPVWVMNNNTGRFVGTGSSWVGDALKWLHLYSAVDYTVTCAGNSYRLRNPRVRHDSKSSSKERKYWPNVRGSFQMTLIEMGNAIRVDQDSLRLYQHKTTTEALVFFSLCLIMFLTFGIAWFFKRCVVIPTVPRGWPGSWGRSTSSIGSSDGTLTARYTPIPRGEVGLIT